MASPLGELRTSERRAVADADWVARLLDCEALTSRGAQYENVHAEFAEWRDGTVRTQVELFDFRVAAATFDPATLAAVPASVAPARIAPVPDLSDGSPSAAATRTAIAFLDAYLSFEPDRFGDLLVADPLHQVGMTRRTGREAFEEIARAGRLLYPSGVAGRDLHVLVSDGRTVAVLMTLRARTHLGVDYENLYALFLDVHDGKIAALIEVYDTRVAERAFDLSVLDRG